MKNYLALMILPVFFIAGCESEQASQPQNNASTSTTAQSTPAAENNSETAADSTSTETTSDTDTTTVNAAMAQSDTAAAEQGPRTGEQVYQQFCSTCHKTGVANAPKFADKAAWEPRIAKGKDVLYQSAMNGVAGTAMTPKGSCMNCSEDELKAAVDYMVKNAQ